MLYIRQRDFKVYRRLICSISDLMYIYMHMLAVKCQKKKKNERSIDLRSLFNDTKETDFAHIFLKSVYLEIVKWYKLFLIVIDIKSSSKISL